MSTTLLESPAFAATAVRPMLKYHIFCGSDYYPAGGYNDYLSSHSSLSAAMAALLGHMAGKSIEWAHIVTSHTIVWKLQATTNPN